VNIELLFCKSGRDPEHPEIRKSQHLDIEPCVLSVDAPEEQVLWFARKITNEINIGLRQATAACPYVRDGVVVVVVRSMMYPDTLALDATSARLTAHYFVEQGVDVY
jgi:hypothetical protein